MRVITSLLAASLLIACASTSHQRPASTSAVIPRVGQSYPPTVQVFSAHKGGLLCAGKVISGGISYNFDVECGKKKVVYVQTVDLKFATSEGMKIGLTLRDALAAGGHVIPPGECGVMLPSGWIARPQMGADTRGTTRQPCQELLGEEIAYFDTIYAGPG